jgi:RNase P subunit RPR2
MNKTEAQEKIQDFFKTRHESENVRKIKRLAMSYQIKLGEARKKFCKKCYSMNLKTLGIRNKVKSVKCNECGNVMRWKIK